MKFFTLCLANERSSLLVDQVDCLRWAVARVLGRRPVEVGGWMVLPNRMHAVWQLPEGDTDHAGRWLAIRRGFDRGLREAGIVVDDDLWSDPILEHAIADEADLAAHLAFCREAPVEAGLVARAEDWPYSSFRKQLAQVGGATVLRA